MQSGWGSLESNNDTGVSSLGFLFTSYIPDRVLEKLETQCAQTVTYSVQHIDKEGALQQDRKFSEKYCFMEAIKPQDKKNKTKQNKNWLHPQPHHQELSRSLGSHHCQVIKKHHPLLIQCQRRVESGNGITREHMGSLDFHSRLA